MMALRFREGVGMMVPVASAVKGPTFSEAAGGGIAMIELPESLCLSLQANDWLAGKEVEQVEAGFHPHKFAWFSGDPADYPALLAGTVIDRSLPVGGMLEIRLGTRRLLFGDGVCLRYVAPGDPKPQKHQLRLVFSDGSALYASVAMYGGLWAFLDGTNDNPYYRVAREKPSPFTDGFDEDWFRHLAQAAPEKVSLKGFLATEQRIPGLGNGVLQDILFEAGMHPKRKLATLDESERLRLYRSVRATLSEMAAGRGRDTETDLFGKPGGYVTKLSRNTVGKPCARCGETISKETWMGGSIYWCPGCQPI